MHYYEGHFWGMHFIWWIFWIILMVWIFATPYDMPGQRKKKDTPLDILKKRFANGEISEEKYKEMKRVIEEPNSNNNKPA